MSPGSCVKRLLQPYRYNILMGTCNGVGLKIETMSFHLPKNWAIIITAMHKVGNNIYV